MRTLQFGRDDGEAGHELVEPLFAEVVVVLSLCVALRGDGVQLGHAVQVYLLLRVVRTGEVTTFRSKVTPTEAVTGHRFYW